MTSVAIKERPILFSGAMVRALLDGSKTQTRRIIKSPTGTFEINSTLDNPKQCWLNVTDANEEAIRPLPCPYGQPGDRLWVRETWKNWFFGMDGVNAPGVQYAADNAMVWRPEASQISDKVWRPSIFMHRWASRLLLEITAVRCERLQDISEADAVAEGVEVTSKGEYIKRYKHYTEGGGGLDATQSYQTLWASINGPESWEANPWVWVVTFKVVQPTTCATLTIPDTSADVLRAGVRLGQVSCINTARAGQPATIRYYGQKADRTASGQAHATQAQAVADVVAWADGREVSYTKQAEVRKEVARA
jgi:hypothetical protein